MWNSGNRGIFDGLGIPNIQHFSYFKRNVTVMSGGNGSIKVTCPDDVDLEGKESK